jgi:hypothetical protein
MRSTRETFRRGPAVVVWVGVGILPFLLAAVAVADDLRAEVVAAALAAACCGATWAVLWAWNRLEGRRTP